ncbi:hypothetical protein [Calidifontibacillus oryziterrae]|uniref:hypothetical protein n=1 Tax=Calidifontibacillus oryziterrae TaxID=1191699 RepID=UPI0012B506AF|nr:hypothetical protein [Calidifontibacillus oryziterrae]
MALSMWRYRCGTIMALPVALPMWRYRCGTNMALSISVSMMLSKTLVISDAFKNRFYANERRLQNERSI